MSRRKLRKPSPAMVVAIIALVFAMAGTGIAASHYVITSTSQIKPSVLKKLSRKAGPVGAAGPKGPAGPPGSIGPPGPTGPVGPSTGAAGGDLTGSYPNPTIKEGAITRSDFGGSAICAISVTTPTALKHTSCKLEFGQAAAGIICLRLPFTPSGGSVTLDAADPGFPVAFLSVDHSEITNLGCEITLSSPNVVITTFDEEGKSVEEAFHAILF
jgi:hypothetical protein